MAFFKHGSRTIHYSDRRHGDGPTLVLANSLGTDFRIWDPLLPHLAGIGRVVRYDKRGHGLSDAAPAPYSIRDLSDDLKAVTDHLGLEHFLLGGVSIGGMIAQDYAARFPSQVNGLVCMDTAPKIGDAQLWQDRMDAIAKIGLEGIADGVMERWFTESFRTNFPAKTAGWRNLLTRTTQVGYVGCCAAIRDADLTEATRAIPLPTLVVCGGEDGATPPALVEAMADIMPDARYVEIAGAGHIPSLEQPEALAEAMNSFFKGRGLV
ncbi:3-oxoadipate enol-lactonase [Nisaea acidiphila]|uniref:3-oxoadipate enol-lactonase n=1 Tax=Nisaea acidiphila TaxID=1862145 RepID=A0A9J7AU34_9PROT|nr:3-oxoadipate enol-lactonase [Nisaea acidiphila]UUX50338.1 3-oxoadipate enol-lactonase [Nisaea acidiphila]